MGDLFDSPWKILIIAIVVLVLFGGKKLPGAAKSLGQSMRILKKEVTKMHDDDDDDEGTTTPKAQAQLTAAAPVQSGAEQQQAQIDALQQQIRDMQRAATMEPAASKQDD